jgi:hypothetical protein
MKFFSFVFAFVLLFLFSCNVQEQKNNLSDSTKNSVKQPLTGTFYTVDSSKSLILVDTIIYDVIVKNPNNYDEWAEFCLKNYDNEILKNIIFNAIYEKRLIAYEYRLDTVLPVEYIKNLEKEYKNENFGKIQFNETWYFDEINLEMYKKVSSIVIGYELVNNMGEVYGYKPAFKVYLDKKHNKTI